MAESTVTNGGVDVEALSAAIEELIDRGLSAAGTKGELWLAYQPQVSAHSGRMCAVEALLRWKHPVLGDLPPGGFVSVAERTGVVDALTGWVLGEALDAQVRWRQIGVGLGVAVNVSALTVAQGGLAAMVLEALRCRDLPADCLTVEVTETAIVSELDRAADALRPLHDAGVRISIDDFGTGFTSLGALPALPLDELKVDRRFVARSGVSAGDEAILRSVRELAHRLGLDALAEGVEDEATARRLIEFGYDTLQGFYFSRPLPEGQLLQRFREDRGTSVAPSPSLGPAKEALRLAALRRYGILDAARDAGFDDLVQLAAHICATSTALISLVDEDRQWFAARTGIDMTETPRSDALCASALKQGTRLLEVADARVDPRFASNPLVVGEPHIAFYAGAPLRTPDGHTLGALCVLDTKPKTLTSAQRRALAALARTVMVQLESRRLSAQLAMLPAQLAGLHTCIGNGEIGDAIRCLASITRQLLLSDGVVLWRRDTSQPSRFVAVAVDGDSVDTTEPLRTAYLDIDSPDPSGVKTVVGSRQSLFVPQASTSSQLNRPLAAAIVAASALFQPLIGHTSTIDFVIAAWWHEPVEQIAKPAADAVAILAAAIGNFDRSAITDHR